MKRKNSILRYFGLTILVLGVVLNILMFILHWWPTYLFFILCGIGIIQIGISFGFSNLRKGWQIFWSSLPFLVGFILFEINSPSDDIFLIPEGYRGQVVIIYGQEEGQPKEYEGRWRVYKIPESGKLKTQFEIKGNSINLSGSKYFYVDKQGNRKELKTFCEYCDNPDTTSIQVIFGSLGSGSSGTSFQDFFIDVPNSEFDGLDDNRFKEIE
ncbi:hypothetical protein WG947_06775 [Pontibacter sp. H259]|uniref:DUF6843 domain-containing protein n=1 Tax=Pontibacter sp. H259 TaxID=3133421 RepID=UPI0030C42417